MAVNLLIRLGAHPFFSAFCLALLLTYVVHSLVWTGVATLVVRTRPLPPSTQNLLWKLALFAPLASAWLVTVSPPGAGQRSTETLFRANVAPSIHPTVKPGVADSLPSLQGWLHEDAHRVPSLTLTQSNLSAELLAEAVGIAAALGLLQFVTSLVLLRRRLRMRKAVTDPRLLARLAHVQSHIGLQHVILTECQQAAGPLTLGTAEICIPREVLTSLSDAELDSVFAHELAHLERGDGLWFPIIGLLEALFWLQPVNHFLSKRFRDSAELACDDRAVGMTGDPLALASALTYVATRAAAHPRLVALPMMANTTGTLVQRVRRLLTATQFDQLPTKSSASRWAPAVLLAVGVTVVAFGVRVAEAGEVQREALALGAIPSAAPTPQNLQTESYPPDAAKAHQQLSELLLREQQLETPLQQSLQALGTDAAAAVDSVPVIELRQELRHVRATQGWVEERFVEDMTKWERRQNPRVGRLK